MTQRTALTLHTDTLLQIKRANITKLFQSTQLYNKIIGYSDMFRLSKSFSG